ncbi:Ribosomal protein L18ae/LX family protein [Prunus dulcis]|uniref:Ribosomal protein L18ae/LX family protein n=1 Tax=Prunus dulcis TaxID=3755 RepID=A0A4Y1QV13_PRUDU|nr:Ribosomal protein L18ae/LX family protein [Prunus dulcis]
MHSDITLLSGRFFLEKTKAASSKRSERERGLRDHSRLLQLSPRLFPFLSAAAAVIITSTDSPPPSPMPPALFSSLRGNRNSHFWLALSPMRASLLKLDLAFLRPLISFVAAMVRIGSVSTDGSDASPVGSPDHASSEIQRQPSDDGMINCLGLAGLGTRTKVILQLHQSISEFRQIFWFWTFCVEEIYNKEQHRMLTDFEGATRRSEVGFRIWTSKEFHQYQVVGRKLPTASDEHPKTYRMKLWATNEVFPEEAEEGQEEQWLMGKWFLLNSPPGEIQFVAKGLTFYPKACEGGCAIGIPSKCPVELETAWIVHRALKSLDLLQILKLLWHWNTKEFVSERSCQQRANLLQVKHLLWSLSKAINSSIVVREY